MAGEIGTLSAILTANAQGLFTAMDQAEARLKKFDASVSRVGSTLTSALGGVGVGLSLESFASAVKGVIDDAGRLVDAAGKLDIGAGALERLELAARLSGVQAETLHNAIGKLQAKLGEAAMGSEEARADFEKLGLSWRELILTAPDQSFTEVARKIGDMTSAYERAAAAQSMMGKGGKDLLPFLREFQGGMDAANQALVRLTDDGAQRLDAMGDAWELLKARASSTFREIILGADALREKLENAPRPRTGMPMPSVDLTERFLPGLFGPAGLLDLLRNAAPSTGGGADAGGVGQEAREAALLAAETERVAKQWEFAEEEFGKFTDAWKKWADHIAEDALDPLEKVALRIEQTRFAFEQGFLNEKQFRQAVRRAEEMGKPTSDLARDARRSLDIGAARGGSVEAASTVNRFLNDVARRDEPARREEAMHARGQRDKMIQLLQLAEAHAREQAAAWGLADVGQ